MKGFLLVLLLIVILAIWIFCRKPRKRGYKKRRELLSHIAYIEASPDVSVVHQRLPEKIPEQIHYYDIVDIQVPLIDYLDYEFETFPPPVMHVTPDTVAVVGGEDSQNVHDSIVQRSVSGEFSDTIKDVVPTPLVHIKEAADEETWAIISLISQRNASVTNLDKNTEIDILGKVFTKCGGDKEKEYELFRNVRECFENSELVCPTGTTSRIISTLFLENPENYPKTGTDIFNEILGKCGSVRESCEESEFPDKLKEAMHEDYSGILTDKEIDDYHTKIVENL